ncbi:unnamed protein product [Schistocephalus solidus]|uniref:Endonuclease/exonuclease/phosphatase domain-containing protein n=1 Tax=Schistocephalus solidus TaxID=70667 RepID=A0A183TSX0_SCHSO|nr:unnamed protein product [Schistocephalus solidus]
MAKYAVVNLKQTTIHPLHPPQHTLRTTRVSPLTLAAWNVRSLLDNPKSNWLEWRTALAARELTHYKLEIAVLSKTRFSEQGQFEEVGAGFTFCWTGRPKSEQRDAGVAFAILNEIVGRLPCLPQGINDCLMSLCLPLRGDQFTTIISARMQAPKRVSTTTVHDLLFAEDCAISMVTPITLTIATGPTPATSVATSYYLPPATCTTTPWTFTCESTALLAS